jgi:DNA repair exonuclease SbcCD ATPase subunit
VTGKSVRLQLTNFQTHGKFVADLDPGVNVFVGPNDSGKSTLFRAIRWVTFHRPSGNEVMKWNAKRCRVRLTTSKAVIVRGREDGNYYTLGGYKYKAIGTSVPQDVQDALRLDSINFQRQTDGHFWLSLSAGDVAEEMNRIVDLSIIDKSMDNAASHTKQAAAEVKVLDELLNTAKLKAGKLHWVPTAMTELQKAVSLDEKARRSHAEYERLSRLIEALEEATTSAQEPPDLSQISPLVVKLNQLKLELPSLERLITFLEDEEADLCSLTEAIEKNKAEVARLKPDLCPACNQPMPAARS